VATELIANSPVPGTVTSLATLTAEVSAVATTISVSKAAPTPLQTAGGVFRIVIGKEIMLVTAGSATTTWTVSRGLEETTGAIHATSTEVFHFLTAGAMKALPISASQITAAALKAGDLLLYSGTEFSRLAKGATGEDLLVRSDGTVGYASPAVIEMSAYKIVGDGVTDNTTAIKEALETAAALTTGGDGKSVTLKFGAGNYITGPQELPQRASVEGIGLATTLTQKEKTTGHLLMNKQGALAAQGCGIRNIRLNGNKEHQEAGHWNCGVVMSNPEGSEPWEYLDSWHKLHNVMIENFPGDGLVQHSTNSAGGSLVAVSVNSWINDGFGFNLNQDCEYIGCTAGSSGLDGFLIQGGSNRLTACKAYFSGRKLVATRNVNKTPFPEVTAPAANIWDGGSQTSLPKFSLANGWGNGFLWRNIAEGTTEEGNYSGGEYVGCNAQDNARAGFYLNECGNQTLIGCEADSNNNNGTADGTPTGAVAGSYAGFDINGGIGNYVEGTSWTRGANLNQQAAALNMIGGAERNIVKLQFSSDGKAGVNVGGESNMPVLTAASVISQNDVTFGAQRGINSAAFTASLTPDPYKAEVVTMTLTAATTVNAPALTGTDNLAGIYYPKGMRLRFVFTQDGTGGRVVTWNAAFTIVAPEGSTEKGTTATYDFIYTGTNWLQLVNAVPAATVPAPSASENVQVLGSIGVSRKLVCAFTGNAAATTVTIKHNLKTQATVAFAQKATTKLPTEQPTVALGKWVPINTNEGTYTFTAAPGAKEEIFITVIG
jgi:hypothetical protein